MPIIITNVTKNPTKTGPHVYEVRVNSKIITLFKHNREDDLTCCLRAAANQIEIDKFKKLKRDYDVNRTM